MLEIKVSELNRAVVMVVEGTVNSETAPELATALDNQLETGHANLVVDLSGVDYMSSAGLRALVAALKRARADSGNLVIAAPSKRVNEVMSLGGLTDVFHIYDDQVRAVGSF